MTTKPHRTKSAVALMLAGCICSAAYASPIVYFGQNSAPAGVVSGDPVTARNEFLGQLDRGVGSIGFESLDLGTTPLVTLNYPGSTTNLTAVLSGEGKVSNSTADGRFNTTNGGSKWWDVSGDFEIDFTLGAISAFGFYATDIGDFAGQVTLDLTDTLGIVTRLVVPSTTNTASGGLLFFGFIDMNKAYTKISFGNTGSGIDGFGFDDLVIGDNGQILPPGTTVPEPGTLALVALSLAGVAIGRRQALQK